MLSEGLLHTANVLHWLESNVFAVGGEIEQHKAGPAIQNRGSKLTVAAE